MVVADGVWPIDRRPHADATVTNRPGLLLGILTADLRTGLAGRSRCWCDCAAHAGWRGAIAGVTDATIGAMEGMGASRTASLPRRPVHRPCIV